MKKLIVSNSDIDTESTFSVKFKGKTYDDAHRGIDGHILFDKNSYEYVPKSVINDEHVIEHRSVEVRPGEWTHKSKISRAKVEILK